MFEVITVRDYEAGVLRGRCGGVINNERVEIIGVDIVNYKIIAFLISAMICQEGRVAE
jgi:hypothetical protein